MLLSSKGQLYEKGKSLLEDLRSLILSELVKREVDLSTGFVPKGLHFIDLGKKFHVHHTTISKVWREFVQTRYGAGGYSKMGHGEVQLIEHLKQAKPSITQAEIIDELCRYGNLPFGTSKSAVSRIVCERLNMTYKKLVK